MTGDYISRAALLLQYYAALDELAAEARIAAAESMPGLQRQEHLAEPFGLSGGVSQAAAV